MTSPLVSVVMPVYNSEKFLKESIESILTQTFTNFEFVIINDGSTDSSNQIIERFVLIDPRIKYINRESNKKIVYTLNEGLLLSKGKFIARMDADDISDPKRLEAQVAFLDEHKNVYAIGTSYRVFNERGNGKIVRRKTQSAIYMGFKFLSDTHLCHPSVMFKREVVSVIGNYRETEAEDFDFFSRLSYKYRCINMPECYLFYREHQSNRSFQYNTKIKESAYHTFLNNYQFYIDDIQFAYAFYNFHKHLKCNVRDFPKCIVYSVKILNKLRKNYNVSLLDLEFIEAIRLFIQGIMMQLFNKVKYKLLN